MMPNVLEKLIILSIKSEKLVGKENNLIIKNLKYEIDKFLNRNISIIIKDINKMIG